MPQETTQRSGLDGGDGRALWKDSPGPTPTDDGLRRDRRPPQLGTGLGGRRPVDRREPPALFAKTALTINIEHPSAVQTQSRPRYYGANEIVWGNTHMPQEWYTGGPLRPELQQIAARAFKLFGATMDLSPESDAAGQRHELVLLVPPGRRHRGNTITTSIPTWRHPRRCRGPAWKPRPAPTPRSSTK